MSALKAPRRKLTCPEIASTYGIALAKVHAWIRAGELRAINAATRKGERPRYLVDPADLEAFETSRAVVPPVAPPPPRRNTQPDVIEFV